MKNKTLIVALVLIFLVTAVVLCKGKRTDQLSQTKATTIKMWLPYPDKNSRKFWNGIADAFEKQNPDINIQIEYFDASTYVQRVQAGMVSKELPDVLGIFGAIWIVMLGKDGILIPLTKYFDPNHFVEGVLVPWEAKLRPKFKGELLAIPRTARGFQGIAYNKVTFARYHLSPPTTWPQYLRVLDVLRKNGEIPLLVPGRNPSGLYFLFATYLRATLNDDLAYEKLLLDMSLPFTNPEVVEAFVMWQQISQYFGSGWQNYTFPQIRILFGQERVATGPGSAEDIRYYQKHFPHLKYGVFGPIFYKGTPLKTRGGSNNTLAVVSYSRHPNESIRFIQYLLSDEVQLQQLKAFGDIPSIKGILDSPEAKEFLNSRPLLKYLVGNFGYTVPERALDWNRQAIKLQQKLTDGLMAISLGIKGPQHVAEELELLRRRFLKQQSER